MTNSLVKIKVKLFAAYQDAFETPELDLEFSQPLSVIALLDYLITQKPQLEKWRNLTRFGVNYQFVEGTYCLQNGDEVVLIPPVSGG